MYRHRIYLSSMTIGHLIEFAKRFPHIKLNVLLSYALLDNNINGFLKIHRGLIQGLILDSGVFSLKALALKMTPDELFLKFRTYCSYSHKSWGLVFNFDRYFRLDSYDKNLAYQIDLEKAGIPVVPVIHNIYNNDVDKIIARGLPEHRTVAIGQCTGRTTLKNIRPAVMKLYDAGAQVHFFGSSEFRVMAQLPITSCDSTSWCKYVGLGIVLYWNPKKSGFDKTDKIHFPKDQEVSSPQGSQYHGTYGYLKDLEDYLGSNLGLTVKDLLGRNAEVYRAVANMLYYCLLEKTISEHQRLLGFVL